MKSTMKILYPSIAAILLIAGCRSQDEHSKSRPVFYPSMQTSRAPLQITPYAIPGTPRATNNNDTGGYAPSSVQAQLKIQVKDDTREVKVIRDNTDPYVITKPYEIRNADPFAVRSYIEAAVGAKSVNSSPAQATAVRFEDGTGVLLVSAEEYRFTDSSDGKGIDRIVASLDRKGLKYLPEADAHIYFPRISRAFNLKNMLEKVGSSMQDPQFVISPSTLIVDAELNALIVKAPKWNWLEMQKMLRKYDRPIPEVKISYRIIEISAENDDRIGVDFQSWKNNDGVDLFSTGAVVRRNWGTFFTSGVQDTGGTSSTEYWNFNPKWNTRYLDFLTSIGKAKCLAQGIIIAQNRKPSNIQVNSGFFYDRTSYIDGATSIEEACSEFAYTEPNPDTIKREALTKIMPSQVLQNTYNSMSGISSSQTPYIVAAGYTMRMMGTQTTTNTFADANSQRTYATTLAALLKTGMGEAEAEALAKTAADQAISPIAKYLTGYVTTDGTVVGGNYYNTDWNTVDAAPGIIHGTLQYPMVTDGFKLDLKVIPVVTSRASKIRFDLSSISLLGWNSDGSARMSKSALATTVQIGTSAKEFVIGGLRKSETVRGTAGLPFFKNLPVIGRLFSTETESIKQSQIVLLARVETSAPDQPMPANVSDSIDKINKGVNKGMTSRVGNMFFQQYFLDDDRKDRRERLDRVGDIISDDYKELK